MHCQFAADEHDDILKRCQRCGFELRTVNPPERCFAMCPKPVSGGAGTHLKGLLSRLGISASNCNCNARAAKMNRMGVEWCEANAETIVGWLREEAAKRKMPFINAVARWLVALAISRARRQSA